MRNWHPLLPDTLTQMHAAGVRRAVGFLAAAQHSYSSCQQYRENVRDARVELRERTGADVDVTYVGSWFDHPLFIECNARNVRDARDRVPAALRRDARLVFTAHSIPMAMAARSRYREQLHESSRRVAEQAGVSDWALVYQSRSGRPEDPWLEPDICDYLRAEHEKGLRSVIVCPIGFICDHIEVLYDLDIEAANLCREIGMTMTRAATVNADPMFLDMMADVVLRVVRRYEHGRPLPIAFPAGGVSTR
jgi:ferrochelatase